MNQLINNSNNNINNTANTIIIILGNNGYICMQDGQTFEVLVATSIRSSCGLMTKILGTSYSTTSTRSTDTTRRQNSEGSDLLHSTNKCTNPEIWNGIILLANNSNNFSAVENSDIDIITNTALSSSKTTTTAKDPILTSSLVVAGFIRYHNKCQLFEMNLNNHPSQPNPPPPSVSLTALSHSHKQPDKDSPGSMEMFPVGLNTSDGTSTVPII
jgi:hypothetical protein